MNILCILRWAKTLLNVCVAAINIWGFKRKIVKTIEKEMQSDLPCFNYLG